MQHGADAEMEAGNGLAAVDFAEDHQGRLMFLRCEEPESHGGDRAHGGREGEEGEGELGEREEEEEEADASEGSARARARARARTHDAPGSTSITEEEEADASQGSAHAHEGSCRRGPLGRAGEARREDGVLAGGQGEGGALSLEESLRWPEAFSSR